MEQEVEPFDFKMPSTTFNEMAEVLKQDLVYIHPGKEDKQNALTCVLLLRSLMNCHRKAQRVVSQDCLAVMRKRLSKLMIYDVPPQGQLTMILKDNLSDIVTTISESLHSYFGSSEKLLQAAMKRDHKFDAILIGVLAEQLGFEKVDKTNKDSKPNQKSPSPASEKQEAADPSVLFCSLLLRNVLNCPKEVSKSLSDEAPKVFMERLTGLMIVQKQEGDSNLKMKEENLKKIAKVISREIFEEFGTIKNLFTVATKSTKIFDDLFLNYLKNRLRIKERTHKSKLTWMIKAIDSYWNDCATNFYKMRTSRYKSIDWYREESFCTGFRACFCKSNQK